MICPRPTFTCTATLIVGLGYVTQGLSAAELDLNQLPAPATRVIDFDTDVKPIFEQSCLQCHGPNRPKGGLRLDNAISAWRGGDNGPAILLGDSTNSPLVHYVAQLDPDSVMPPPGKGDPLTITQVSLLRAWIDQGAWWGKAATNESSFTVAPAIRFTAVSGNQKKFSEHYGHREGWRGGVESFSLSQQLSADSSLTLGGRALTDDYRVDLRVEKPTLGFYHFGFEQFRKYDADTGGYFPLFSQPTLSLNRDLHLDVGRAWMDFGLTLPDWPRLGLGYEYQYRHGDKSTLQWGAVTEGANTRAIFPGYKFIDERTHILKLDLDHTIADWHLENSFRGEWAAADTRHENVRSVALDVPNSLRRDETREGWKSFQGANTFRIERAFREWLFASGGYLYSHLAADADFSLDQLNAMVASTPGPRTEWRSQSIVLERESHVGNLNLLLGPWQSTTLALGAQGEWTRQNGTLSGTSADYTLPPFLTPDSTAPIGGITDIDRTAVDESALLRINQLPFTTLFAEARLQQEQIKHAEDYASLASFARDSKADSYLYDWCAGFDTSPTAWLKFGSHYRWRAKATDYDDGFADGDPADITGYPTLISARDLTTQEIASHLTLRASSWLKSTFTHRLVATDYRTTTEPISFGATGDVSPGGSTRTGNFDAQILSLNVTVTPTRRLHAFSTISFQDTRSRALHDYSTAVVPYRGETWSFLGHGRYVLTARTDLTAGYTFSTANFRQDLLADGLAVGRRYDRHAIQAGLVSRCSENFTTKLQYGFYQYNEPSAGGANDYTAHAVFVSFHWVLN
jgi:mono/diheme cytochrome c family protein